MKLSLLDLLTFFGFIGAVIGVSVYASRREETSEDYFLAGRRLGWWLIGFSLIASNISTEHFVGMAGEGFKIGLAIASYEWIAAITLVLVGIFLLPRFLKSGIYTMPEYLEYRYNLTARSIMAFYMMVAYVVVAIASVLYAGAIGLKEVFGINTTLGIWFIGITAGAYTIYGGLGAVVWSDLLQGAALLLGGLVVTILGFRAVGGVGAFLQQSADKLHTILPANHETMPWVILVGGIWIPNIFYWGLNQFITQRTLGARNLKEGQRGILLAAALKLLIPFIVVFPGIMSYQLYGDAVGKPDEAYPYLIRRILPIGLRGIMMAALFGAIMSSLDSMLNSAATIFTNDFFKRYLKPQASNRTMILVGRIATAVFVIVGCLWAQGLSRLEQFKGIFDYIQRVWGFISPGIVAVFIVGIVSSKVPPSAAVGAMLLGIPVYGLLLWLLPDVAFLNHMLITFLVLSGFMMLMRWWKPMSKPKELPVLKEMDLTVAPGVKFWGCVVIAATIALYIIFW